MSNPHSRIDSPERIGAVHESGISESIMRPALDRLIAFVCAVLKVPVAIVSFVEADKQTFASHCGLPEPFATMGQTPLSHSFCQHVVTSGKPLLVGDARLDPRLASNLAIAELSVVAYAGVPVRDLNGMVLGAIAAIDSKPREWTATDAAFLEGLSAQITAEIALRQQSQRLAAEINAHRDIDADRQELTRPTIHDLRTPLAAVMMSLDLIRRLGPLTPMQEQNLALSRRNGASMLNLLDNIIDIGSIDHRGDGALNKVSCSPAALIAAAREQVELLAQEKSIRLIVDDDITPLTIDADFEKITRVLVDLLANAIKFTISAGEIQLRALACDCAVRFEVSDTGIGMADPSRIFQEGVRLDSNSFTRRSTGLGLTFCKRIVEAHLGRIWVESTLGQGSTFFFTLPASRSENAAT